MKDNILLNDNELEEISGGANGRIPEGGITYNHYDRADDGRYYADINKTNYAYVYRLFSYSCSYRSEILNINNDGTWSSKVVGDRMHDSFEDFKMKYPYRVNIKPDDND